MLGYRSCIIGALLQPKTGRAKTATVPAMVEAHDPEVPRQRSETRSPVQARRGAEAVEQHDRCGTGRARNVADENPPAAV